MGIALDKLGEGRCKEIAQGLYYREAGRRGRGRACSAYARFTEKSLTPARFPSVTTTRPTSITAFPAAPVATLQALWQQVQGRPGKDGFKAFCAAFHIDQEGNPPGPHAQRQIGPPRAIQTVSSRRPIMRRFSSCPRPGLSGWSPKGAGAGRL